MFNRMLFDDFRRSFDRLLEGFGSSRAICSEVPFAWTFAPAVETGWTENHFNLRLIVPGVTEKDLKVTVQGNQLYVQGERKEPKELSKSDDSFRELAYCKFESMIDLPSGLELEKLEAHLHDGVLDIRIPGRCGHAAQGDPHQRGQPESAGCVSYILQSRGPASEAPASSRLGSSAPRADSRVMACTRSGCA